MRKKKCKSCNEAFMPTRPLQAVCGPGCAIKHAEVLRDKKMRSETRRMREKIKTKAQWLKEAQAAVNKYIRLRDHHLPCISCGRHHQGQYHAGHYRSIGSCPELRFTELNIHKQCMPCNSHKSGNVIDYRINLIKKIGLKNVEWLEGPHEQKKYTIEDIQNIKTMYNKKCKMIASGEQPE